MPFKVAFRKPRVTQSIATPQALSTWSLPTVFPPDQGIDRFHTHCPSSFYKTVTPPVRAVLNPRKIISSRDYTFLPPRVFSKKGHRKPCFPHLDYLLHFAVFTSQRIVKIWLEKRSRKQMSVTTSRMHVNQLNHKILRVKVNTMGSSNILSHVPSIYVREYIYLNLWGPYTQKSKSALWNKCDWLLFTPSQG